MAQWLKNLPEMQKTHRKSGFHPWVGKITWRRKWQPTPVFLPEKSHWQKSLAGYSPSLHARPLPATTMRQGHAQSHVSQESREEKPSSKAEA